MKEKIFILKSACLLHDPPTKAWDIIKRRSHEEMAKRIAENILKESKLYDAKNLLENDDVKRADLLAASLDRWLLRKLVGEDYGKFYCDKIKIKNIFNPQFSIAVSNDLAEINVEFFAKKLNNMLKHIHEVSLAYHVLYAFYEPCWIINELPSGPADTRAPSHSVFDHDYATASIMNWVLEGKEARGILLFIDLGGVQRFISSSRKLSDLWISSYLASSLAWYVFWFIVKRLGPDVMILPTCRGNPFYYHSLISELQKNGIKDEVINEVKNLVKEVTEGWYDPHNHVIPRYAAMPVTATFILPDIDVLKRFDGFEDVNDLEDLKGLIRKKYEEGWKKVYDIVIEECKKLNFGILSEKAATLLEACESYGFDKVAPLPIRIVAVHTKELYDLGFPHDEREIFSLYHYMFKLLNYKEWKDEKVYKFRPEEELKLYDMTSKTFNCWKDNKKGFDYCSVCGSLPAIIIMPSDEKGFEEEGLDLRIEPIFGFGERFCPYCLIKRFLTLNEVLKPSMDFLIGKISDDKIDFRFPSLCDIAVLPFKKSLIKIGIELSKHKPHLAEDLSNRISDILKSLAIGGAVPSIRQVVMKIERDLSKELASLEIDHLRNNLEVLLSFDSELGIMRGTATFNPRKHWLQIREELNKTSIVKLLGGIDGLNTYYAIIRGDADSFGKIIHGKMKEGFRIEAEEYLSNILEGDAKKVIQAIIEGKCEEAKKICENHGLSNKDMLVDEISKFIAKLKKENGNIIISPSYHSALSRALIVNAFNDVKNIELYDGLAVYVGGDDLLAVMPVKKCLEAVKKLREAFSFPSHEAKAFYKIKNYYMPSLATASRSFSIYLTHYMFPMYICIDRSMKLLDEFAKEAKYMINGINKREKDSLVLSYSARGGEQSTVLPFYDVESSVREIGNEIMKIQNLIDSIDWPRKEFSSSLIYDLYELCTSEVTKSLILQNNEFLFKKVVEEILDRNCNIKDKEIKRKKVEEWREKLLENYRLIIDLKGRAHFLFKELILSLKLYISGLKEVA